MHVRVREVRYVIGVDEAGRGPLAGPVAVGAVRIPLKFDWNLFEGVRDSKQLSPQKREEWYEVLKELQNDGGVRFAVAFSSSSSIDRIGIVPSIKNALSRALNELEVSPRECTVLLDGSLIAPKEYLYQKTIIRGDESEIPISLASIAAKVLRDKRMVEFSKRYPVYGFDVHKGYGTKVHRDQIEQYGICDLHRKSFLKGLTA